MASLISRKQLRLFQLPVISRRIIQLVGEGRIEDAIQFLDDYHLMKEDFDEMLEICLGNSHGIHAYSKIQTATKASFTRLYNKLPHHLPYPVGIALAAPVTKEFGAVEQNEEDALFADEIVEEEESDIKTDKMVKQKTITAKPTASRKKAKKE